MHTLRYYERRGLIAARRDSLTHCACPDCPLPHVQLADQGHS
ncbi:hypothetical protein ACQP2T_49425 [Nonomuraea sp. CA-143628]